MSATVKPPFRATIAVAGALAILLSIAAGFVGSVAIGMGACGGDGGTPYAGYGSERNRLCNSAGQELMMGELMAPPLVALVATAIACLRRRFAPLMVGGGLAMLALFAPFYVLDSADTKTPPPPCEWYDITSDHCS